MGYQKLPASGIETVRNRPILATPGPTRGSILTFKGNRRNVDVKDSGSQKDEDE